MKTKLINLYIMLWGIVLLNACSKFDWDVDHNTTLSSFNISSGILNVDIISEEENSNLNETHLLSWNKSAAENYTKVFYTVQFSSNQDFSTVAYSMEAATGGTDTFLEISNNEINIAAERAGIKQSSSGTLYWRVWASNGVVGRISENHQVMTITRPAGFAYIPEKLFLSGSATEAGTDMTKAIPFRKTIVEKGEGEEASTVFEIFTWLQEGEFYLIEKTGEQTYRQFSIAENRVVEDNAKMKTIGNGGMHRISIEFDSETASYAKISDVELWYSGIDNVLGKFSLAEDNTPVWNWTGKFEVQSNDYRYKFRMKEELPDGSSEYRFWGYQTRNAAYQNEYTIINNKEYFYVYEVDDSKSNYCYRFNNEGLHENKTLKISLDMQHNTDSYNHLVEVLE